MKRDHLPRARSVTSYLAAVITVAAAANVLVPTAVARSVQPAGGDAADADSSPVEIVLLGTTHFAGSEQDTHSSTIGDILSERRQRELTTVAESVAEFGPDRVFLECDPSSQATFDSLYRAYRAGKHDPTAEGVRNERQQLGFRMARRSGTGGVTCADGWGLWLGNRARAVAREHNPAWLDSLRTHPRTTGMSRSYLEEHTLPEYLTWLNTDSLLYQTYEVYNRFFIRLGSFQGEERVLHSDLDGSSFAFTGEFGEMPLEAAKEALRSLGARVLPSVDDSVDYLVTGRDAPEGAVRSARTAGARVLGPKEMRGMLTTETKLYVGFPDRYIGADLVGEWYKRNLRIYANLLHDLEPEDRRAVLLIGQAHVWPLRTFLRANPAFEVVSVDEVL